MKLMLTGLVILFAGVIVPPIAGDKSTGGGILLGGFDVAGAAVLIASRVGGGIGRR